MLEDLSSAEAPRRGSWEIRYWDVASGRLWDDVLTEVLYKNAQPHQSNSPAFFAFQLKVRRALGFVLVFETDLLGFGCLAAGSAHFDLALVEPALVDWGLLDVVCFGHAVVELELFHKAFVGFAERSCLADLCQSLVGCDAVSLHKEGAGHCGRP